MRPKSTKPKATAERVVKDIRRATRRHFSAEDKIRIVLEGLRGDDSIAGLCQRKLGVSGLGVVSQDVVQLAEPFGWRVPVESIVRSCGVVPVQIAREIGIPAVG